MFSKSLSLVGVGGDFLLKNVTVMVEICKDLPSSKRG
jgi:hypothetical protein